MATGTKGMEQTVAALGRMTLGQLREKYLELFGEPTRSGNRDFLFKRLAWRVQSLAEGTLSERARRRAEELARDADIRLTLPRPPKPGDLQPDGRTGAPPAPRGPAGPPSCPRRACRPAPACRSPAPS